MLLAELGWDPDQIKNLIIQTLTPYFKDKQFLSDKAIDLLPIEAVNVGMIGQDVKAEKWLHQLLDIHQAASKVNEKVCFQTLAHWEDRISHATDEFWSAAILEQNTSTLPLQEFKFEIFRTIGMLIEACLQPQLKALLAQVRLSKGDPEPNKNLDGLELGKVINELHAKLPDKEIVAPVPWNIRLNQWRNMAQHHKTRVKDNKIVGAYGVGAKQTEVILERAALLQFVTRLNFAIRVVLTSRTIFILDNLQKIEPYISFDTDEREDVRLFRLATSFATQGFEIERFEIIDGKVLVWIFDKTGGDTLKRAVHCSQLIYSVWLNFSHDFIEIESWMHLEK